MSAPPNRLRDLACGKFATSTACDNLTPLLLVIAAFLGCTALFFGITQIEIDIGRDFAVADLMLNGSTLYRDVNYWYGPVAPWLHYWLFRSFGPSTTLPLLAGAAASLLIVTLTYLIARQVLPAAAAVVSALLVLSHAVYGPQIFQYATPYTFAATYGLLFSLAALYSALRSLEERSRPFWDLASGAAAALALASKQEFGAIALTVAAAPLAVRFYRAPRLAFRPAFLAAGSCLAVTGAVVFFLLRAASLTEFLASYYPTRSMAAWQYFYSHALGWGNLWPAMLEAVARCLVNFGFVLAAACLVVALWGLASGRRAPWILVPALIGAVALFGWNLRQPRYFPILLHAVLLTLAVAGRVRGDRRKIAFLAFAAAVFQWRVLAHPRADSYALLYFAPSLVVYMYLCYEVAAARLARFFPRRRLEAALSGVFLVCFLVPELAGKNARWAQSSQPVKTPRGELRLPPEDAAKAKVVLQEIERRAGPGGHVLLAPEGAMYYFLAGRTPPSRHLMYSYGNVLDGAPEREEIRRLEAARPRLIVIDEFPQELYFPGPVNTFGRAYNAALGGWIEQNYEEVRAIPYKDRQVRFLVPRPLLAAKND